MIHPQDAVEYTRLCPSPLGPLLLLSDGAALTGLGFDGQGKLSPGQMEKNLPVFDAAEKWLDIYFSGGKPDFTPPLRMVGTDFQLSVWKLLLEIPHGKTTTYGELARRIATRRGLTRMSAQAVGGAVGRNAIPIIVPCHRVIGADGSLTGYGGGMDRKIKLLALEKATDAAISQPDTGPGRVS